MKILDMLPERVTRSTYHLHSGMSALATSTTRFSFVFPVSLEWKETNRGLQTTLLPFGEVQSETQEQKRTVFAETESTLFSLADLKWYIY